MKTHLEFTSTAFPAYPGEDKDINPGIFEKRLAEFLAENRPSHGFKVLSIGAEDWGWMVEIENKEFPLWIGCASYEDGENGFQCFIEPSKPFVILGDAGKKIIYLHNQYIMAFLNDSLAPFHRVADPRSTHPQSLRQCPERYPRLPDSPIAQKAPGPYLLLLTSLRENLFLFHSTDFRYPLRNSLHVIPTPLQLVFPLVGFFRLTEHRVHKL